jgi:thiol-disulfide isomerase/thioredoxin
VRRLVLAAVAMLALAGCSSTASQAAPDPEVTGAFQSCGQLGSGSGPATGDTPALPEVKLPCFDGSSMVSVNQIKGPAVINIWASWCGPCRDELPVFARLAAKPGAPKVIGVVDTDRRSAAASLATELGVAFPTLFDERGLLGTALGQRVLPVTLFIDGSGHIAYTYRSVALTDGSLAALIKSHL